MLDRIKASLPSLAPAEQRVGKLVLADPRAWVLYRSDTTRSDDTAQSLLQRLGASDTEAQAFIARDPLARQLISRQGRLVHAETSPTHQLQRLTARSLIGNDERGFQRLVIERTAAGFTSRLERGELQASPRLASGIIRSSLFASTDEAGIPDAVCDRFRTGQIDVRYHHRSTFAG